MAALHFAQVSLTQHLQGGGFPQLQHLSFAFGHGWLVIVNTELTTYLLTSLRSRETVALALGDGRPSRRPLSATYFTMGNTEDMPAPDEHSKENTAATLSALEVCHGALSGLPRSQMLRVSRALWILLELGCPEMPE